MPNGQRIARKMRRAYERGQDIGRRRRQRAIRRSARRRRNSGCMGCLTLLLPMFW